jgi:mono/diheme cytochrome c family protein
MSTSRSFLAVALFGVSLGLGYQLGFRSAYVPPPAGFEIAPLDPNAASAEKIDHTALIRNQDQSVVEQGKAVYTQHCIACHGADGGKGLNAQSRQFISQPFQNGGDVWGMYQTLMNGYKAMPAQTQLSASEKYAVIHFIRATFTKPSNPSQYIPADDDYIAANQSRWPALETVTDKSGPPVPHPLDLPMNQPVQALMDRAITSPLQVESPEAAWRSLRAKVLAVNPALAKDLAALDSLTERGRSPRARALLDIVAAKDAKAFKALVLGGSVGGWQGWFATRSAAHIDALFQALTAT